MNTTAPFLNLCNLSCSYGNQTIIRDLSLSLKKGELGCLLGSSGCGKSTLLRAIAGFVKPVNGQIFIDGLLVQSDSISRKPEDRGVGFIYQDFALFPHLSVSANIEFGIQNKTHFEKNGIVLELLNMLELNGLEYKFPSELSGGQQQRVAIARSLAVDPKVLLLDEPFSGLDSDLKRKLAHRVKEVLKHKKTTALLVTHDQDEALIFADRLGIIQNGTMKQWDSPKTVYENPANPQIATFLGSGSLIYGLVENDKISTLLGDLKYPKSSEKQIIKDIRVLIRPEQLYLDDQSHYRGTITQINYTGNCQKLRVDLDPGSHVITYADTSTEFSTGDSVGLRINDQNVVFFADDH